LNIQYYKIALIIPCYNEEKRLPISEFTNFYAQNKYISFFFVNDGSKDDTKYVLNKLSDGRSDRIHILDLQKNSGKAEAVRHGILKAINTRQFDYVGYFDADLSTSLDELSNFIESIKEHNNPYMVCGSRIKLLGRIIERKWYRHYLGRIFSTFVNLLLGITIYDSQCGAKLFKTQLAKKIFIQPFISSWLFDIELLLRTTKIYGKDHLNEHVIEVPLKQWKEKGDSKISFFSFFNFPVELLRIWLKY